MVSRVLQDELDRTLEEGQKGQGWGVDEGNIGQGWGVDEGQIGQDRTIDGHKWRTIWDALEQGWPTF